jgi:hypothetical protein
MKKIPLILLMLCAAISHSFAQTTDFLIHNGKSDYLIVISEQASAGEIRAAELLGTYLDKMTDCELPLIYSDETVSGKHIVIHENENFPTGDEFSVSVSDKIVLIEGGNNKGCIYGVCEWLEVLGIRYYSPDYVVIPELKDVLLPENAFTGSSPNTYRNVHGSFCNDPDYRDFNRINHIDDMFADGYYVHTFSQLLPWQEYFATHSEYYTYRTGKRLIDQPCMSNPEVLQIVIEKLEKEMQLQPDKKVWSVSQNDNPTYCQCDNCMKIIEEEKSPAGPVIRFVNQVAEHFPDKVISTLAYTFSRQAPVLTKPLENVQIMLCTIELNRSKPIATDPTSIDFLKDLTDWGKISNHIYLWDYTVDFEHSISPFPNLHVLQANIQLFVKNNVKEHFQQSNIGVGHEFSELKSWVLAKLLWNPEADVPALIESFTNGFYGPAAPWIRKYIFQMQDELLKSGERLDIFGPPTQHANGFLSAENIAQYNSYFDEAEKAVSDNPDLLLHVRTARMPLQYAIMEIGKSDMFGPRGWYEEIGEDFVVQPKMIETLESFFLTSKDCQSTPVNESGLTPEQYYQATKRFIDVQVKGNQAFRKKVTASPFPAEKYSRGDLSLLTNGVRGANDFKVHWLGWEAQNFILNLDLEKVTEAKSIEISTLYDPRSWILHPQSIECLVSEDGINYVSIENQIVETDQRKEDVNRLFRFDVQGQKFRFVKINVLGTLRLPDWHYAAGGGSWVFVDEIVVK